MLRRFTEFLEDTAVGDDGVLGTVHDMYIDDRQWVVRYFVLDTGHWYCGGRVLVSPECVGVPDPQEGTIPILLSRSQVQKAPDVGTELPVSRRKQKQLAEYYGWSRYMGPMAAAGQEPPPPPEAEERRESGGPALRSAREIRGYRVHAQDGHCGRVRDLVIDPVEWAVRYLVVRTGEWLGGCRVIISPHWVEDIDWFSEEIRLPLSRHAIRQSPSWDFQEPISRRYEKNLHEHYDRVAYWD